MPEGARLNTLANLTIWYAVTGNSYVPRPEEPQSGVSRDEAKT
jgi:hypothetical protein